MTKEEIPHCVLLIAIAVFDDRNIRTTNPGFALHSVNFATTGSHHSYDTTRQKLYVRLFASHLLQARTRERVWVHMVECLIQLCTCA